VRSLKLYDLNENSHCLTTFRNFLQYKISHKAQDAAVLHLLESTVQGNTRRNVEYDFNRRSAGLRPRLPCIIKLYSYYCRLQNFSDFDMWTKIATEMQTSYLLEELRELSYKRLEQNEFAVKFQCLLEIVVLILRGERTVWKSVRFMLGSCMQI